jgi:hypothetical protein
MLTFDLVLAHVDVRRWRRHIAGEVVDHFVCLINYTILEVRFENERIVKSNRGFAIVACHKCLTELSAPRSKHHDPVFDFNRSSIISIILVLTMNTGHADKVAITTTAA